jgi:hypothetical protein
MNDLPRRPLLTPETARATPLHTLLGRVDAFTRKHPDITIAAPYTTLSKLWEVSGVSGTSQWDNGFRMMDFLEQRYRNDDDLSRVAPVDGQRRVARGYPYGKPAAS